MKFRSILLSVNLFLFSTSPEINALRTVRNPQEIIIFQIPPYSFLHKSVCNLKQPTNPFKNAVVSLSGARKLTTGILFKRAKEGVTVRTSPAARPRA